MYIVPWDKRGNSIEINQIIQEHAIAYTKATPAEYFIWMQYGHENLRRASSWRFAFGGGEPLTISVTEQFADLELPQLHVFNSYGPTEISISSTKMEVAYRDKEALEKIVRIPGGYSLPNYYMYVLDEQLKPLPIGMPGELYIGGAGVSLGYLNNKELTSKHFVPDPFTSQEDIVNGWTRMYRTSDIGYLNQDRAMVFQSRVAGDTQVKVRGLRIELSDIESNIISAAGVLREAVVSLGDGDPDFLVTHVVFTAPDSITDKETFLEQLLSHLQVPQYMVPVVAISLDKFPLTNHFKVDQKAINNIALPKRFERFHEDKDLDGTMMQPKDLWQDVLGNNIKELGFNITPSTNFFHVGGNSLLIIKLQSRIPQAFNIPVPLIDLLDANALRKWRVRSKKPPASTSSIGEMRPPHQIFIAFSQTSPCFIP